MVNAAKRAIALSISILHLALILTSSAGTVTCIEADGSIKIEASCEQTCICDDPTVVASSTVDSGDLDLHEHDTCGDCTDFFLSRFLQATNHFSQLDSDPGPVNTIATGQAWSGPDVAKPELQSAEWCAKPPPQSLQKIASLKTAIVIC
ncbi:MAG: hypothetical protein OEV49_11625 [candidate division Zixibacteria bacterium]|nr:hypothetical protein [candidate division Zixibacteria bacterium]MDH3939089.1 hypothetical protein [candidate division Zixibacteria bacterium]MDH4034331.1 hypothetical protein [candidate division Zixibacteria bacterium]